jgi:hypothetical protein
MKTLALVTDLFTMIIKLLAHKEYSSKMKWMLIKPSIVVGVSSVISLFSAITLKLYGGLLLVKYFNFVDVIPSYVVIWKIVGVSIIVMRLSNMTASKGHEELIKAKIKVDEMV